MWHSMFAEQIPLAEKILRTVIVYAVIALLFRLTGKRGLASLSTFDFVVIFLLSNVVQNAIIGNDTSLTGGHVVDRALRHLGMRRSELDTAVRLQSADSIAEVETGRLEPGGQLVLALKAGEQGATKADIAELTGHLRRIEKLLSAPR
jgi:uncharacterized membrane protein YcaP (DUF421 family)